MTDPNPRKFLPAALPPLTGHEAFVGVDATVAEFWRWGFGDLRMNIVRGVLAEFLVARALGIDTDMPRNAWDNFDLVYEGTTLEIKSTARWQSYAAERASPPIFKGLRRRRWDETGLKRRPEPEVIADLYVFAMHTCETPGDYDPLSTSQWSFFVLPGDVVRTALGVQASAGSLRSLCTEVPFDALKAEVDRHRLELKS